MLIGRWRSNVFLIYIEKKIKAFTKGVNSQMLIKRTFYNTPLTNNLRETATHNQGTSHRHQAKSSVFGQQAGSLRHQLRPLNQCILSLFMVFQSLQMPTPQVYTYVRVFLPGKKLATKTQAFRPYIGYLYSISVYQAPIFGNSQQKECLCHVVSFYTSEYIYILICILSE